MAGSEVKADLWLKEYITPWDVYEHGVRRVLAYERTPYQEMYIIDTGTYGKALILDGKWQSCTGDEFLYHEALVQPACLVQGAPKTVLILGGGEGATVREVLRWRTVEQVVMVDIDAAVVAACKAHLPEMHAQAFDDPRVEVVIGDALVYIAHAKPQWDIIISDVSDPIEQGPAFQLFTREFFSQLQSLLTPQGYCVVQAGSVAVGEIMLHARLVNTLKTVFTDVVSYNIAIPTFAVPWGFALCADRAIETRPDPDVIDGLIAERTTGGFQLMDGTTLLGLLQTPRFVRSAIATHTQAYTLSDPPKFFGQGIC